MVNKLIKSDFCPRALPCATIGIVNTKGKIVQARAFILIKFGYCFVGEQGLVWCSPRNWLFKCAVGKDGKKKKTTTEIWWWKEGFNQLNSTSVERRGTKRASSRWLIDLLIWSVKVDWMNGQARGNLASPFQHVFGTIIHLSKACSQGSKGLSSYSLKSFETSNASSFFFFRFSKVQGTLTCYNHKISRFSTRKFVESNTKSYISRIQHFRSSEYFELGR